jgi:hypothetical protein
MMMIRRHRQGFDAGNLSEMVRCACKGGYIGYTNIYNSLMYSQYLYPMTFVTSRVCLFGIFAYLPPCATSQSTDDAVKVVVSMMMMMYRVGTDSSVYSTYYVNF